MMGTEKDNSSFSMLDLFRTEVSEQGKVLTDGLLALENNPSAADRLEALMRAAHSIKGAARLVGVEPVVRLAHVAEDVFVAAQNSEITLNSNHVDVLLNAVDRIISISGLAEKEIAGWEGLHGSELNELVQGIAAIKSGEMAEIKTAAKPEIPGKSSTPKKAKTALSQPKTPAGKSKEPAGPDIKSRKKVSFPAAKAGKEAKAGTAAKPVPAKAQRAPEQEPKAASPDKPAGEDKDRVLRVTAERWNHLMGLAGEVKVEAGWLHPYVVSLDRLKRRQIELVETLDALRCALDDTGASKQVTQILVQAQKKISECRSLLADQTSDLDSYDRRINNLSERLHRETIKTRMRPFSDGVHGFQRMVRDIAKSLGKKAAIEIHGLSVQVDRDVLEKMEAPMNHILRNALDHGIEPPAERIKAGKPEQAAIRVTAVHSEGMLSIMIDDDGRGIDIERLRKKVTEKKLVTPAMAAKLSEKELLEFLFLPSFSTREEITDLSGRGVGLDVVLDTVQKLRGSVETLTRLGEGTRFHMRLPLTMSVVPSLIAEISGEPYAFPLTRIIRVVKLSPSDVDVLEDHQFAKIDGENIGLVGASQVLGLGTQAVSGDDLSIVVIGDRHNRCGVVVDKLLGQKELAIQILDPRLGKVPDVSTAAVLEDGTPVLILDIDDLVLSVDAIIRKGNIAKVAMSASDGAGKAIKYILVVDDSLTVREVERNLLENAGYHVDVAVDGSDGWNAIRAFKHYDLVVTDIDMPRMDGIELVRLIKSDRAYNSIPVIIVSYKERESDRRRGMEAGADYYLTKGSFHDKSMLDAVADLIGETEA
ncbi:MAG: hybrid sensor histidine kinase/response regulator [Gallionella sp.]|nr:hybrid sensor histidine kinase/response regulator [Gallionella sp.]